jgi:hypothetical protein
MSMDGAMTAVVEDGEELAVAGEVLGEAGPRERVGDRVCREARLALLAVGDDRLAGRLEALDRVLGGLVLQRLELLPRDLAVVEVLVGVLQLLRTRKRAHELGGDRHALSSCRGAVCRSETRSAGMRLTVLSLHARTYYAPWKSQLWT